MLEQRTVVALVDKESGLLSFKPIDIEFETVFYGYISLESSYYIIVYRVEACLVGECGFRFVIHILNAGPGKFSEGFSYDVACIVHSRGVSLEHSCVAIYIYHTSWQEVALTVHEAECGVVRAYQSETFAQCPCLG